MDGGVVMVPWASITRWLDGSVGRFVGSARPIHLCAVCGRVVLWLHDVDGGQECRGRQDQVENCEFSWFDFRRYCGLMAVE